MLDAIYMLNLVNDVRGNVNTLESSVNAAHDAWNDVNYERIAQRAMDVIRKETDTFYSSVQSDAQCIYNNIIRINTIVNSL